MSGLSTFSYVKIIRNGLSTKVVKETFLRKYVPSGHDQP